MGTQRLVVHDDSDGQHDLAVQLSDGTWAVKAHDPDQETLLSSILSELELKVGDGGNIVVTNVPSDYPDSESIQYLSNRYSGGKLSYAGLLSTSGDNVVIQPSSGRSIRVFWVSFVPDPDNSSSPLVTVKFSGGDQMYVGYAMAHWEIFEGAVDESVVVNLSEASDVAVTIHYMEV